jgi:hypothetical protein
MEKFIIKGINGQNNISYYTGKASGDWLSSDKSKAFRYSNNGLALSKADMFSEMYALHGFTFTVEVL